MRRIALPLPFALRLVNVYLVEGERGWTLVDTGLHTDDGERELRRGMAGAGIGFDALARVFVTHLHPDHIGMAGTLQAAGAHVAMHRPEIAAARRLWFARNEMVDATYAWFAAHGMPRDVDEEMRAAWLAIGRRVDAFGDVEPLDDGQLYDAGGRPLRLAWTPGHTDYHAILADEREGILFAGDQVLPRITPNVGLYPHSRDDPLGDFLASLRRVRDLPLHRVLPAHGEPFDDLAGRVDELLVHHDTRLAATIDAIGDDSRDAYVICRTLFPRLRSAHEERFALAETLAHLRHLERIGRVTMLGDRRPVLWRRI